MKPIKFLIVAAVVVTAGVLVWHLMWMQEMDNKYDVKQLLEEAHQLPGERKNLTPNVAAGAEQAVPVIEDEMVQGMPDASQEESMKEPLQENKGEVRTDVVSRPELITDKKPEHAVQVDQESDFDQPVEKTEILDKDENQFKSDPNQPRVITIKGKTGSKVVPNPRQVKEIINYNTTPVKQHPTSTSP